MRFCRATCAVVTALFLCLPPALAVTTVTFDDIDASAGDVSLDAISPYQGLSWSNFFAYTSVPGFDGYNNGIVSAANAAYSGGEFFGNAVTPVVGAVQSAGQFNFLGGDFGAGYYNGLGLTITGYLGAAQLYTQTLSLGTTGAQSFAFNFAGIDRLTFSASAAGGVTDPFACGSFNCTQFTVDNLSIQTVTAAVPEPSTILLLALGLAVLVPLAQRRPRQALQ